jgi:enoyl-CoA hydratase
MQFENLLVDLTAPVATITVNRPRAMNSLSFDTLREMEEAFTSLEKNAEIKVIILTGAGQKAFVAGGDISAMENMSPMEGRAFALLAQDLLNRIERLRKPVIAAINGYALGGGCELSMSCDLRIAADTARFGQPEVNLGIIPGWAGTQRLPRLVGKGRALELLFTGDMIDAAEAHRIGLVNRVVPADQLLEEARKLAEKIASKGQVAIGLIKDAVNNGLEMDSARAIGYEAELFGLCFSTEDQKEGMNAFLNKRKAEFRDR